MCTKKDAGKLVHRKLFRNNILRLRKYNIVSAIKYRKKNKHTAVDLQNDILNCIDHILGQHSKCANYFCKNINDTNMSEKL